MSGDNLILALLQSGNLEVDFLTGKIYSRRIRGKTGERTELLGSDIKGYRLHTLHYAGDKKLVRAHRIIWIAANGLIPEGLMIDHINRSRSDNRLENLRLVDSKGNAQNKDSVAGENNPSAKLTYEGLERIRQLRANGATIYDIANIMNISKSEAYNIVSGKTWKQKPLSAVRDNR